MISPALSGRSRGFVAGRPLPSTAGWPMPSLKPNDVRPVGELVAVLTPDQLDPGQLGVGLRGPSRRPPRSRASSGESTAMATCTSAVPSGFSQWSGPLSPTSPRISAARRHPLPELRREAVQRRLRHAERLQPVVGEGDRDRGLVRRAGGPPAESTIRCSRRTSSRPSSRSSMRSSRYVPTYGRGALVQRAALDVVELEGMRPSWRPPVTRLPWSVVLGRLGRVRIRRRQVGKADACPAGSRRRRRRGSWGRGRR